MVDIIKSDSKEFRTGITAVNFYIEDSEVCKELKPLLEKTEKEVDIKFYGCDINKFKELVKEYEIDAYPTLAFLKDGKLVHKMIGIKKIETIPDVIKEIKGSK